MTKYKVFVTTGDVKGAGTNAKVLLQLKGKNGELSEQKELDKWFHNDFERNSVAEYEIVGLGLDDIVAIIIRREDGWSEDDWFVEHIRVIDVDEIHFPLNRWIRANDDLKYHKYDSILPQNDPHREQRDKELVTKKESYKFLDDFKGLPRFIESLPPEEVFSKSYKNEVVWETLEGELNVFGQKIFTTNSFDSFDDIYKLYKVPTFDIPQGQNNWRTDEKFAALRLIGPNSTKIELCKNVPKKFPVDGSKLKPFLEGQSLNSACTAGLVYIVDYADLEPFTFFDDFQDGNDMVCPFGLFYSRSDGVLIPLAIQLFQKPGNDNPIFYPPPTDEERVWLQAKFWFNVADSNYHEPVTHLLNTHLVAADFVTCFHHTMSPSHPIYKLMLPHFIFLCHINFDGLPALTNPGGIFDKALSMGTENCFKLMVNKYKSFRWDVEGWFPAEIKKRGVENLKNYHWREDSQLLFDAIQEYIRRVVTITYGDEKTLIADSEIQEFAKLFSSKKSGMKGVPGGGSFKKLDDLVKTLTSLVFIVSNMHAAANFCQYDEYGYPPNYSSRLKGNPPTNKNNISEEDLVNLFTVDDTLYVMKAARQLSLQGTNKIGSYETKYQWTPAADVAYKEFVEKMGEITEKVNKRNRLRRFKYYWLSPEQVPNSISI